MLSDTHVSDDMNTYMISHDLVIIEHMNMDTHMSHVAAEIQHMNQHG